jgi:fibronectin type 3 domain-containing protein
MNSMSLHDLLKVNFVLLLSFCTLGSEALSQQFIFNKNIITNSADGVFAVFAIDVDGDGDQDVLSANWNGDTVAWYENIDGNGSFGMMQVIDISADGAHSVYSIDIDGDGDNDILSASIYDDTVAWYENKDGQGDFGAKQVITNNADGAVSVFAIDIDGDGDQDVLSASTGDDTVAWYKNLDGEGSFGTKQIIYNSTNGSGSYSVYAADLDGDDDSDVVIANNNRDLIIWFENSDGQGNFEIKQVVDENAEGAYSIIVVDLDGDQDLDILSSSIDNNTVAWYENMDAEGDFGARQVINNSAEGVYSVDASDIDLDGDLDIINSNAREDHISWYENLDGLGNFGSEKIITFSAEGNRSVYSTDLDGDGDLDIISANQSGNDISWYENKYIANDSLIAHFLFEGNPNDQSDNNYDGIIFGEVSTTQDRFNNNEAAYSFGPGLSYIKLPYEFIWNTVPGISISTWIKPYLIKNEDTKIIDWGDSSSRYFLEFSNTKIKFGGEGTRFEQDFSAETNTFLDPYAWVHLVAIIDTVEQSAKLFKNGQLIAETLFSGQLRLDPFENDLKIIGARQSNFINQFEGKIDEIKVNGFVYNNRDITNEYRNYHAPDTIFTEVHRDDIVLKWSSERIESLHSYSIYRDGNLIDSIIVQSASDTLYVDLFTTPEREYEYYISSTDTLGFKSQTSDTIRVVRPGLIISDYSFSGDVNDSSGYGFHGTNNGATFTQDRFGIENSALFFDGQDDYVLLPSTINALPENAEEWSTSFWISPDSGNDFRYIFSDYYRFSDINNTYRISINDSTIEAHLSYTGTSYRQRTNLISTKNWHHLALVITLSENLLKLYYNGVLVGSPIIINSEGYRIQDVEKFIGAQNFQPAAQFYRGLVDDLSLHSKALSDTEILGLYSNYHAPDTLIAQTLPAQSTLKWSSERIESLRSYQVYRDGSLIDFVEIATNIDTTYIDQNIEIGSSYSYYITSTDSLGNVSQPSDTVTVTIPDRLNDIAITKVYPEAAIPGNSITLFVSDISSASEIEVLFGDAPATINSRTGSKIVVEVPDIEPGAYTLRIVTESSTDDYNLDFTVVNISDGVFGKELILNDSSRILSLEIADLDDDGFKDIIYTTLINSPESELRWQKNIDGINFGGSQVIGAFQHFSRFDISDVDNDGDIDIALIATANSPGFEPQFLQIYINDGNGNFANQNIDNSTDGSSRVFFSDLNLDGEIDLLTVNNWSGTAGIYFYENQGGLTFAPKINIGAAYQDLQTVDLDNDGDLDLLSNRTYWLRNNGDNSFQQLSFEDGDVGLINAQAFSDFDFDGFEDLILFSSGRNHLSYYRNNLSENPNDPRFHFNHRQSLYGIPDWDPTANYQAYKIEIADFNGDGFGDVIVPFAHNDSVYIWFFNSNRNYFDNENFISTGYNRSIDMESADLDNDGDLDIVISSYQNSKFSIHFNLDEIDYPTESEDLFIDTVNPDSVVLSWTALTNQTYEIENYTLYRGLLGVPLDSIESISHIDNSLLSYTDTDIIDGNTYQYSISATNIHNIEGQRSDTLSVSVPSPPRVTKITPLVATSGTIIEIFGADFDSTVTGNTVYFNNSLATIISATSIKLTVEVPETNFGYNRISVQTNVDRSEYVDLFTRLIPLKGNITFQQGGIVSNEINNIVGIVTSDLDNDGDKDIVSNSNSEVFWFENQNGNGQFSTKKNVITGAANIRNSISIGDLDLDGYNDLIFSESTNDPRYIGILNWLKNYQDGANFFQFTVPGFSFFETWLIDNNNDGFLDINGFSTTNEFISYLNLFGTGVFEESQSFENQIGNTTDFQTVDLDLDGDQDLITANPINNQVYLIENTGGDPINWETRLIIDSNQEIIDFVLTGDLNGDNRSDIISSDLCQNCNLGNTIVWYENLEVGGYSSQNIISDAPLQHQDIKIVDLDADGDNDIVAVSIEDGRIVWHENLDGKGNFGPRLLLNDSQNLPNKIQLSDLDNDGDLDIVVASTADTYINWFENISTPFTLPSKVEGLSTNEITPDSVFLSWNPVPEEGISHYKILRGLSTEQLDSIAIVQGDATFFSDKEVEPNTKYWYTISGVSTDGLEGERSDTIQVRTLDSKPLKTAINTEIKGSNIQVTWNEISNVGIQYYKIYRGITKNQLDSLSILDQSSGIDTSFTDTEVLTQVTYWYSVSGVNYDGLEGEKSDTLSSIIPIKIPDKVESLAAREINNESIEIAWDEVSNTTIIYYKIYRRFLVARLDSIGIVYQSTGVDTMFTDQNVDINQEYWYSVSAVSSDQVEGEKSDTLFVETPKFIPEIISGVILKPSDARSIEVSWSGTLDLEHDYYKIYRGVEKSLLDSIGIVSTELVLDTVYLDDQVFRNNRYWYAVSSVNTFGVEGGLSDTVSIMLDPIPFVVQSLKAKTESFIPSTIGANSFQLIVEGDSDSVAKYVNPSSIDLIIESDTDSIRTFQWAVTDSTIVITPDTLFASEQAKIFINSDSLISKSNGEFYIDGNKNLGYDEGLDNYTSNVFTVASLSDFDLNGVTDFDDFMLLSSVWSTTDYSFDIAPYRTKEEGFPFWQALGDSSYDLNDLITFTRYWEEENVQEKRIALKDNFFIDANTISTNSWIQNFQIHKKEVDNSYNSSGGSLRLTYDLRLVNSEELNGVGLKIKYDIKELMFERLRDKKLFGLQTVQIVSHDSTRGFLYIYTADFGNDPQTNSALLELTFDSKGSTRTNIEIIADLRFKEGERVLESVNTFISEEELRPTSFELFQNYPNPFNPTTTILYAINETDYTTIKIYSLTGQKVAELVNTVQEPGYYSVKWDASNLASGMYIYRLESGAFSQTKRMLLIK